MIFLDTNVVSETVRANPDQQVLRWLKELDGELHLSTVVLAEIAFGIARIRPPERAKRLEGFVATLRGHFNGRIHGFDERAAIIYGEIMGAAQLAGQGLSTADGMIAAITFSHNATLATRNVKDFAFLKMKVVNPWES